MEVYFGWMGLGGHFFMGWQGWLEVYSGWLGVNGCIFCVNGCCSWVGGAEWAYILGGWE